MEQNLPILSDSDSSSNDDDSDAPPTIIKKRVDLPTKKPKSKFKGGK
jgi:hypothetical protein